MNFLLFQAVQPDDDHEQMNSEFPILIHDEFRCLMEEDLAFDVD